MDATSRLLVRPMSVDDARRVAGWRYRERWSTYDLSSPAGLLEELHLYSAVTDSAHAVVGFVCVGSAARVPGLDADPPFVDVGVGMDPDVVGKGSGRTFGKAVLDHLARRYPDRPLRAVVQAWNVRSLRFAVQCGFVDVGDMSSSDVPYRILVKPAHGPGRDAVVSQSGVRLFGDRLMLREFVAADLAAVHSYAADPIVTRFTAWGPNSIAESQAFIAHVTASSSAPDRREFALAAVLLASGTLIGSGEIRVTDVSHRRGEIGYVLNRSQRSRGYATDIARLLVDFGFEHLMLRRIAATCDPDNGASARVLEKAGLRFEGRMRSHLTVRGTRRDSLLYATVVGDV
ncbi:GNAT family N-acetyltransferase [Mycolicibacterium sp.]|uniref:GNAT family N-acetyltransferase n=1 Tax=Mycolicibacterium sp. TaxID=2320850 RepID=UPI001A1CC0AD|nr:GNAT family N-acetyltransferase [Mycolicibacterium sp.]MBJ7338189.1 GNAT N-acetyltransferase [Mycolicibacterium sp.]